MRREHPQLSHKIQTASSEWEGRYLDVWGKEGGRGGVRMRERAIKVEVRHCQGTASEPEDG